MSDFEDNPVNIGGPDVIKKRKLHRQQKFRQEWCSLPELKNWLMPDKDPFKAACKQCKTIMVAELTNLKSHAKSIKHRQMETAGTISQRPMTSFKRTNTNTQLKSNIQQAEIKLSAFIAEHNIPLCAADHLPDLLKKCFPDSKILQGINMKLTKTSAIVKNVIGVTAKEELSDMLRASKFNITDESTDIPS
ncbi:uncharacterized protein LOC132927758 [Rhopalosiphum padi]|uniref:uncharacterized protein LOC132927758 n=1 Tax=Rhopalosiphum padi TaxID=40932 RepID=UPI00298EBBB9|nr:uncharacterized protein LOC132927758 [Rhopalosiphum padi]